MSIGAPPSENASFLEDADQPSDAQKSDIINRNNNTKPDDLPCPQTSKTKSKLEKIENIKKRINHLIKGIRSNLKSQDYQNYQIPEAAKKMSEIKELINEVDLTKTQLETINDLNKKLNKQNNIYFANIKRRNTKAFKEKNVRTSLKLLKEIERHLIALTTYEYLEQYKVFLP